MVIALSEARIISKVAARFGATAAADIGIGDDTAVLDLVGQASRLSQPGHLRHLITTDTLIEGVHFDLSYMSLADVGYKALAVNLSDINAMGGASIAVLGTLGVPKGATESDIDALLDGIEEALRLCNEAGQEGALVGGDTVASPQWMVGFTVIGTVEGEPLLRSGARPGDIVWHSGALGLSGVGFEQLRSPVGAHRCAPAVPNHTGGTPAPPGAPTVHRRPVPPLTLGPWLQGHGYASAAQDLSDSLSQVALQLAQASGVRLELDFREYEFAPEFVAYAMEVGAESKASLLLAQAEDYQLLFTTPPEFAEQLGSAPAPCTQIGRIVVIGNSCIDEHGRRHELQPAGFQHL